MMTKPQGAKSEILHSLKMASAILRLLQFKLLWIQRRSTQW